MKLRYEYSMYWPQDYKSSGAGSSKKLVKGYLVTADFVYGIYFLDPVSGMPQRIYYRSNEKLPKSKYVQVQLPPYSYVEALKNISE
jgi:hypothetical protein